LKCIKSAACILALLISGLSYGQQVSGVAAERRGHEDVITVRLSSPADPWAFFLKDPDRLVVDIRGGIWGEGKGQLELDSGNISSVRWARNSTDPPNFRVVADLKRPVEKKLSASPDGRQIFITVTAKNALAVPEKLPIVIEAREIQSMEESSLPKPRPATVEISAIPSRPELQISAKRFSKEIVPVGPSKIEGFSSAGGFSVFVAGNKLDIGRSPVWSKGRLMVPAKDFFSLAGYSSLYDKTSRTAVFRKGEEVEAKITEGSDIMTVNGAERRLSAPVMSVKGSLYVPYVSASNMISLRVLWDKKTRAFYAGGRLTGISWEEVLGYRSVVIDTSVPVATYETSFDEKLNVFVISIPGMISDLKKNKVSVKEDGVTGIKVIQDKGSARVGIYMESPLAVKPFFHEGRLVAGFPAMIRKVAFTEEAGSIKVVIASTKPVEFELKRFRDPERIIIDIPNALYGAEGYSEINRSGVLRVRASQFQADPPASRIVVDTDKELLANAVISEDRKNIVLTIEKPREEIARPARVKALAGKAIVIDPGHGGKDPGALGVSGDRIKEKDLNLATSLKLAKLLSDAGAIPLLTRDTDVFVSLQERVEFTKRNKPHIFLSVHFNLSEKKNISGTETYYFHDNSHFLAQVLHRNLTFNLKRKDGGVRKIKFYVVYNNSVPSVLVEPLYLSDSQEEALAANEEWQLYIAKVLFEGIKQYFEVLAKK
jgi:N-acetylmuramoyl-L-alanine amidase